MRQRLWKERTILTVSDLCLLRWECIQSASSTRASMCLGAPSSSLWGLWGKGVLTRSVLEALAWRGLKLECQVGVFVQFLQSWVGLDGCLEDIASSNIDLGFA